MARKDKEQEQAATPGIAVLRIRALRDSFWRCGRQFFREPVDIPEAQLSAGEIDVLCAEPLLAVERIEIAALADAAVIDYIAPTL